MKKINLKIIITLILGFIPSLLCSQQLNISQDPNVGITFTFEGFKDAQDYSVSLWDITDPNNERYITMGYSVENSFVIKYDKINPGSHIKVQAKTSNSQGINFLEDQYIDADSPLVFSIPYTIWINGRFTEKSSYYKASSIFGASLFSQPSNTYNKNIAEMSIIACGLSYPEVGKPNDELIIDFLTKLGFKDIKTYNYYNMEHVDRSDLVGMAIGHRTLYQNNKPYELIFVIIRGTIGGEWYSNFDIGENETLHKGFEIATIDAAKNMQEYVNTYNLKDNLTNSRLLITGHSRGASVANMISRHISISNIKPDNLYIYTFAAPNYTRAPQPKDNSWNFINSGDLVPTIPFWDFTREGHQINTQDLSEEIQANAKANFKKMLNINFVGCTPKELKKVTDEIKALAPDISSYYNKKYDGKLVFKKKTMTTYDFCNIMAGVILKKEIKEALNVPKEFNGVIWLFIKDSAASPSIIQSHSIEYYLGIVYSYNGKKYDHNNLTF